MTVYVDNMAARYRGMLMCHMIADSADELHAMADRIGVARKWYQRNHYDISQTKRRLALAAGAVSITWRDCSLMTVLRRRDANAPLLTPAEGLEWLRRQP